MDSCKGGINIFPFPQSLLSALAAGELFTGSSGRKLAQAVECLRQVKENVVPKEQLSGPASLPQNDHRLGAIA